MITSLFLAVLLHWNWNTEPYLGGYNIYWGSEAGLPSEAIDVGKVAEWNADEFLKSQPAGSKLYFTVKAYNTDLEEGFPSNEVSYVIPLPGPTPAPVVPPHTHSWNEITGKPATFPSNPHTHSLPDRTGN